MEISKALGYQDREVFASNPWLVFQPSEVQAEV